MSAFRQAACVILLRKSKTAPYDIYLTRRNERLSFMGGFHAFAGGSVEPTDAELASDTNQDAIARVAALRELFEELGVLATTSRATHVDRAAWRARVVQSPSAFNELVTREKLSLATQSLIPMGRWQTPPYTPARFDASYYALWLPEGEAPSIIDGELVDGLWVSCDEALAGHDAGTLFISYPVLETLRIMRRSGADLTAASNAMNARGYAPYPHAGGEMIRGVYMAPGKTPTLPPATHTNTYILGGKDLVIVDPATPYDDDQDALVRFVQHLTSDGRALQAIWLTHHHRDHTGAVLRIKREFNVPVYAHPLTQAALDGAIPVDHTLEDGQETTLALDAERSVTWRALHTPGHTRGHLCFYDVAQKTLLSGDLILGLGTVLVAPPEGNMVQYLGSLERLLAMPLGFVFPAHGPPVAAAHHKIQEYIAHRMMRESAIVEALRHGAQTPPELVQRVYTDINPQAYPLAELNVRAHLEKLVREHKVAQAGESYVLEANA